jgi:amidase
VASHVLTLSVRDSALAFAIADATRQEPAGTTVKPLAFEAAPRKLKVALITRTLHGGPLAGTFELAMLHAADLMRSLGHEVVPCDWPIDAPDLHGAFFDRWAYSVHREFTDMPDTQRQHMLEGIEPWTQGLARAGAAISPERVEAMVQSCLKASAQMEQFHREWDILMTPIAAKHPILVGEHAPDLDYATLHERVSRNVAFTPLQNITGQPGMSVPLYWAQDGLPVGVHFSAGLNGDDMLFQLAYQLEAAQPWAQRLPPHLSKEYL